MDQQIIPKLIFIFTLITYLVNLVLILLGEILSWSVMGVKGLTVQLVTIHVPLNIVIKNKIILQHADYIHGLMESMSVSEQMYTHPSPNPKLTLAFCQLTVIGLG